MKICICGGGSLGHVCSGILSSQDGVEVNLLTGHPERWTGRITVTDISGKEYIGKLNSVSDRPEDVIPGQDMILICLPGFLIENTLKSIKSFIGNAKVGSIVSNTGFFFFAHEILGTDARLFGFQRVPFISRVAEYGKSANLLGNKSDLAVALENIDVSFTAVLSNLFGVQTRTLGSFYEAALTNSNPILHTGRLYSLFNKRESELFDHNILFYKEWTDEASQLEIDMDGEFFELLKSLDVRKGSIPTLLEYYESKDAHSLTKKIQSISAFQTIVSPMKEVEGGWIADFGSRYFTEDFPFGLKWIKVLAAEREIATPTIDKVLDWGLRQLCE